MSNCAAIVSVVQLVLVSTDISSVYGPTSKYSFHSLLLLITSVVSFLNVSTCFWSTRASHQCYI